MQTAIIPSYLYQQYSDDANLQGFVAAYNTIAQEYLDWFNQLNLPIYTSSSITGALLDWVALGIYGMLRPALASGASFAEGGAYNTLPYDTQPYNQNLFSAPSEAYIVTDDYFKRVLTWNFYKGDGFQFNTNWLKRRIERFLNGVNGIDPGIQNTYDISVHYSLPNNINITIPNTPAAAIFQAGVQDGVIQLPFQYQYNITL